MLGVRWWRRRREPLRAWSRSPLYPEQDAIANPRRCWNWFDLRSGRAAAEAASICAGDRSDAALYPVDPRRVAVAGLSAGASMAALLATRYPQRFTAVAMHSGVAPDARQSSATIVSAMQGRRTAAPLAVHEALPPLLIVHGSVDRVAANRNPAPRPNCGQ
ncbi:MAG: PHB depolymerase family esterase [Burkholderiaceae bacterium]